MASRLSTPLGFTGIFLLIIGILMLVGGIIGLIVQSNQTPKSWWVWFLIAVGFFLGIIGAVLLAIALSRKKVDPCNQIVAVAAPAPIMYQQPTPIMVAPPPYVAPPAPQYIPAPQPIYQQVAAPNSGTRTYAVGQEHFDPDPQTVVTTSPSAPRRVVAQGPYGPGGQIIQVPGTYTPPATVTETTVDIPNHPVVANQRPPQYVAGTQARYVVPPQGRYVGAPAPRYVAAPAAAGTRTYAVGQEQFDPDPQRVITAAPAAPRRVVAQGPYGPGGQIVQVPGTYTPPATVTETDYDIPNHRVVSNQMLGQYGAAPNPMFGNYATSPSPYQAIRTY